MGIRARSSEGRGQSGPLGFILVFAVVIASSTLVVALGAGAVEDSRTNLDVERTEKAMTQLDSQAALVALGQTNSQRVDLSASGSSSYRVDEGTGWMNLSYENATGERKSIVNETMGSVVYDGGGETTIAYQGGGVWRSDGGPGSVMISPPEFHYRDATLTLPLVTVRGEGSFDDRAVLEQADATQYFPNATLDDEFVNPLEGGKVNVTVHSDYYQAWGTHFEERTDGDVSYDHANQQVTIELTVPIQAEFDNVVATTEPGGIDTNGPDGPPSPYEDGVTYPDPDEQIEDEIDDCDGTGSCEDGEPTNISSDGTYYYGSDVDSSIDVDEPGGNVSIVVDGEFNPSDLTVDIDDDHSVTVFVREDFVVDGGDEVNVDDGDPTELKVIVHSDGDVDLNGKQRLYGVVFAPGSECDLNGNNEVTGALICETMDINGKPTDFNYDDSVADTSLGLEYDDRTRITFLHVSVNDVNVTSR